VGDKQEFFVARRGEAFITGLQAKNAIRVKHNDKSCSITIELPTSNNTSAQDEILRLGPYRCEGVAR
jgi:outer membrane usher protein